MPACSCRKGFTLIELLAVISIVALLAALAVPGIGMAQNWAKAAKSASNLRQIGVGLLAFAGDNEEKMPEAGATIPLGTIDHTTGLPSWTEQLQPYLGKDLSIYQNPTGLKINSVPMTYGYFLGAHAALVDTGAFGPVSLLKMPSPAKHIIAGENRTYPFDPTDADPDDYTQDPAFGGTVQPTPVNLLFGDGHVRAYRQFDSTQMTTRYDGNNTAYLQ